VLAWQVAAALRGAQLQLLRLHVLCWVSSAGKQQLLLLLSRAWEERWRQPAMLLQHGCPAAAGVAEVAMLCLLCPAAVLLPLLRWWH
jgi:hypothetical protein